MKRFTVNQLARASGVSVRALHHYDEIGLLKPAFTGENRYRYYGQPELLRLQQILCHRELGLPLQRIAELLDAPGFDRVDSLKTHRDWLLAERERLARLVMTIDRTIADLEGNQPMKTEDLYQGFAPEKQQAYEQWLVDKYGTEMRARLDDARARQSRWSPQQHRDLQDEMADIESALSAALAAGTPADSAELAPLMQRHHAWVSRSWPRPPDAAAYAGLADLYTAHPDFSSRYESLRPGLAAYLAAAMRAFAARELSNAA
jgi:DNA-binding transcriptional MerR regulator